MGKRKSPQVETAFTKKRKSGDDNITPKQRQMMALAPEETSQIDTVRSWDKKSSKGPTETASSKLPILGTKGKWKSTQKEVEDASQDESEDDASHAITLTSKKPIRSLSSKTFDELKLEMANLAVILSETPEQNMKKLGELRLFCDPAKHADRTDGMASKLVQLAMLTTLTVMKDLMPGYAIRSLTEEEQKISVSKEVQSVRSFEHSYLSHYKGYLQRLHRATNDDDASIKFVAYVCLCELLQSASHFNRYEDVVKWVSQGALGKDGLIGEECSKAIRETFKSDEFGKSTFMIINCTSDIIKDRDYLVPGRVLQTYLSAHIRTDIAGQLPNANIVKAPRGKKSMSKRDQKEMKKKLAEMQKISDAEALVSKEEQERWNSDSLRYLFRVYFGVLKRRPDAAVMPEVLRGLAHFAHLISKDEYFGDLLRSLKAVTESAENRLTLNSSLQAVLTVARIQALQEKALAIDIKFVYNYLFRQLTRLMTEHASWSSEEPRKEIIGLLREVYKALLGAKLSLPSNRLAAFAQRLADIALFLTKAGDELSALDMLNLLHSHMEEHRNVRLALLDRECYGQGAYLPECPDPDMCNPYSRTICLPLDQIASCPSATPRIKSLLGRITAPGNRQN